MANIFATLAPMFNHLTTMLRDAFNPLAGPIPPESDTALMVLDVQKEFCSPWRLRGNAETRAVTRRIIDAAPQFRAAGIPVYPVYYADVPDRWLEQFSHDVPRGFDHYKFYPAREDRVIIKNHDSAFRHDNVPAMLHAAGHKHLLLCGFNLNSCVRATALDAVKAGFTVHLLRDLTGNDRDNPETFTPVHLHSMKEAGIRITSAATQLQGRHRAP